MLWVVGDFSLEVVILFNLLGVGICWGVMIFEIKLGDVVVVLGLGIWGLCVVVVVKGVGVGFVMVIGLGFCDVDWLVLVV